MICQVKDERKNDFISDGNVTLDLNYLPISGGTMTGTILLSKTEETTTLARSIGNDFEIDIYAGDGGARLALNGKNRPKFGGMFILQARDETHHISLDGNPNGSLTWGSNQVITSAGGIIDGILTVGKYLNVTADTETNDEGGEIVLHNPTGFTQYGNIHIDSYQNHFRIFSNIGPIFALEQDTKHGYMFGQKVERVDSMGNDYIRYYGGLQICWGLVPNGTWTFPQWFSASPTVLVTPHGTGGNLGTRADNVTTTSVNLSNGSDWLNQVVAIGKWG